MMLAVLLIFSAFADDLTVDKIVISGGGGAHDIMRSVNAGVDKGCTYSDKQGDTAFEAADGNDDDKLQTREFDAMSRELNSSRHKGCRTIKLVTDGM